MADARADDWLTRGMRRLVERSVNEAAKRGTTTVEAEHVLLALAVDKSVAGVLDAAGLGYEALDVALRAERARSLAAAGIEPIAADILRASPRLTKPRWGASVAMARARVDRSVPRKLGIAVGILRAEVGTVPRALALAGIDRVALISDLSNQS